MTDKQRGLTTQVSDYSDTSASTQQLTQTDREFEIQRLSVGKQEEGGGPEDKGNAVYLTFILYGIGVLLPFNVIMACLDWYFSTVS